MHIELKCTYGVGNVLDGVALAVGKVIHRVDAPFVACTVMVCMDDTVQKRIAEKHIRVRHINLGTEDLFAISIFAFLHFSEQLEVFLNTAVAPRALRSRNLDCTTACTDFFLALVIYIGKSLLYQFLCPKIELVKIVGCISFILPFEAKPADVFLNGIHIFSILLDRIGVVKAEIGLSAVFFCKAEVDAYAFCVAYMKISVRFRRKACHYAFTLAGCEVRFNYFLQEVQIPGFSRFFVQLFHML